MAGRLCLLAFASLVLWSASSGALCAAKPVGEALDVTARPVLLDRTNPAARHVGSLTYLGGWSLESDHPLFGGWSALIAEGERLTFFSDAGAWMRAAFDPEAGLRAGSVTIGYINGRGPDWSDKERVDLEAAIPFYPFGYLAAFEQTHRIEVMTEPGGWHKPVPLPPGVGDGLTPNGGFEAMVFDSADRLLLFAERGRVAGRGLPAWRIDGSASADKRSEPFFLDLPDGVSPTAAARLGDGTILILGRSFSLLKGVRVRVLALNETRIEAGATVTATTLAELRAPNVVDNFEGMALLPAAGAGRAPRLLLVSDDNFNPVQRTLLLVFELATPETGQRPE